MTDAKRRLLDRLKLGDPATAAELAAGLGLTDVAVRQHLAALEAQGLVEPCKEPPQGRGRPATRWSLTPLAQGLFPERHAELTVGLIGAMRDTFGEKGLLRVIDARAAEQVEAYRRMLPPPGASLRKRVTALARQRTAEGYMAEVKPDGTDAFLLIEHHCPICDAARSCVGLCHAELDVFQRVLGPDVTVERTQHLLSGDQRCVYRIRPR